MNEQRSKNDLLNKDIKALILLDLVLIVTRHRKLRIPGDQRCDRFLHALCIKAQEGGEPHWCDQVLHLPLQPGESGSITCVTLPKVVVKGPFHLLLDSCNNALAGRLVQQIHRTPSATILPH